MKLDNLTKKYKQNIVFKNQNFDFSERGVHLIKGESGVGKSTLFAILTNQDSKYKANRKLKKLPINKMTVIEQNHYFVNTLNVVDNIQLGYINLKIEDRQNFNEQLIKMAKKLNIFDKLTKPITELSGGELAKVAFLRAILNPAEYLICDEPTANMDIESINAVIDILKEQSQAKTIILITHENKLLDCANYIHELTWNNNSKQIINVVKNKAVCNEYQLKKINFKNSKKIIKKINLNYENKHLSFAIIAVITLFLGLIISSALIDLKKANQQANGSLNENVIAMQFICDSTTHEPVTLAYGDNSCADDEAPTYQATLTEQGVEYLNNNENVEDWYPVYVNQTDPNVYFEGYIDVNNNQDKTTAIVNEQQGGTEQAYFNPAYSFTKEQVDNNEYLQVVETANNETSSSGPIDGGISFYYNDSLSGLQDDGTYYPEATFLPNYYLTESSPTTQFVNSLITAGSLPMPNQNEVLITNEFMNLQFNTDDPSKVIGQTIDYCFKEISFETDNNVVLNEQLISNTCESYTITGVYNVSLSSDNEIYFSYDEQQTLFYSQPIDQTPYIVVELKDGSQEAKANLVSDLKTIVGVDKFYIEDTVTSQARYADELRNATIKTLAIISICTLLMVIVIYLIYSQTYKDKENLHALLRTVGFTNKSLFKFNLLSNIKTFLIYLVAIIMAMWIIINAANYLMIENAANTMNTYSWLLSEEQITNVMTFDNSISIYVFTVVFATILYVIINMILTTKMLKTDIKKLKK